MNELNRLLEIVKVEQTTIEALEGLKSARRKELDQQSKAYYHVQLLIEALQRGEAIEATDAALYTS